MRFCFSMFSFCLLLGTGLIPVQAQTVESLVARNIEAKGGLPAIKALQNVKQEMTVVSSGMEIPVTVYIARPGRMRSEAEVQGMRIITAYDGEAGWVINPMMSTEPQPLPSDQIATLQQQADLEGVLVDYQKKGYQLEYGGLKEVEGKPAHALNVTRMDGAPLNMTLYLDADSYLERLIETEVTHPMMGTIEVSITLGDYQKVNGVMFPFMIRQKAADKEDQIRISEIQTNIELEEEFFTSP